MPKRTEKNTIYLGVYKDEVLTSVFRNDTLLKGNKADKKYLRSVNYEEDVCVFAINGNHQGTQLHEWLDELRKGATKKVVKSTPRMSRAQGKEVRRLAALGNSRDTIANALGLTRKQVTNAIRSGEKSD